MPTPLPLRGMFAAPSGAQTPPTTTTTTTPQQEQGTTSPWNTTLSSSSPSNSTTSQDQSPWNTTLSSSSPSTIPTSPQQDLRNPYGTTGNSFGPNGAFGGFVTGQGYVNDQQKEPDQRDNITSLLTNRQFQYFDPTRGIFSFGRT